MHLLAIPFAFIVALFFVAFLSFGEEKDNAEFEAKNCPDMLKLESKFCKPLEHKQ